MSKDNGYYGIVVAGTKFLGMYRYHGTKDYFDVVELWKQSKGNAEDFHRRLQENDFIRQPQKSYQMGTFWFFEVTQLKKEI